MREKILWTFIIILISINSASLGYNIYSQNKILSGINTTNKNQQQLFSIIEKQNQTQPVTPPDIKPDIKQVILQDETALYKKHINPAGYSVDYPAHWSLHSSQNNENTNIFIKNEVDIKQDYPSPCPNNYAAVSISGPYRYEERTFEQLVQSRYSPTDYGLGGVGGKQEKMFINGLLTYKFEYTGIETNCSGPTFFIKLDDKRYLNVFTPVDAKNKTNLNIISMIVDSIKFTK